MNIVFTHRENWHLEVNTPKASSAAFWVRPRYWNTFDRLGYALPYETSFGGYTHNCNTPFANILMGRRVEALYRRGLKSRISLKSH